MENILNKQPQESFNEYHIRLYDNLDEYGINSHKAAELLNKELGSSYSESKWRKDHASYHKWRDFIISQNYDEDILAKYESIRIESEKEKIRNQDQKREFRKMIRHEARFEKIKEDITKAVSSLTLHKPLEFHSPAPSFSQKEGLLLLSDWHFGMDVENRFNKFNKDIFLRRIEKVTTKAIEYGKLHNIKTMHVAQLGDLFAGLLHVSTRVQSNEDIVNQLTYVAEVLAQVLTRFCSEFPNVKLYNVIGNHGRVIANKNDVGIKENFEYLIPWFLEARLSSISNIEIIKDSDGLIEADIMGEKVLFVHGNYDTVANSAKAIPQMLGYTPSHLFMGHIHHNVEKEHGLMTVTVNGSLIGVDDHAVQKRLFSKPSQKFIVFDEDEGAENTYLIKLDKIA
ncbi:hypothetical protein [Halalkalibacter oceani]|uniref:hypothetical protein n=1 Tax=Halalkalibacter oceani TaxID=1653776 RepID=UPI0033975E5B